MRTGSITAATLALLAALLVSTGAVSDAGAAGPSPAAAIDSISPTPADRGGLVQINGNGFGGPNVKISVDGALAEVVSATGSRAPFRVPPLAGPGRVIVRATNPGGRGGEIALNIRFDGNTIAVADAGRTVSAPVGAAGATIAVDGMSLAILPGAVPAGTTITATPLRSLAGSPFAAAPVGLKLEPSGSVLLRPATLRLPKPSGPGVV